MASPSTLIAEPVESEMIISLEFDKEELEVLAGSVPTPYCGNGSSTCASHCGVCSNP